MLLLGTRRGDENVYKFKKRTYVSFVCCLIILCTLISLSHEAHAEKTPVAGGPREVEVILQRVYLDGEISEEEVVETIWSMEDFWSYYEDWEVIDLNEHQIIFKKEVNDISPLMKMHGYFGMTEDGTLSIYNGKPSEKDVIQSFFQINTSELKSHLHDSLIEGIPVSTKDQYFQVLKLYEEYAINEM
ncbi:BofC C-terminal domain-containing protein [Salipaludibacillus agaradhaerens]|uniref:intercompartmental signaling factor BofC n=1 Tax=Salipaludibacillus agaradhaerens TaxID=76935 RepID=UPI0021510C5D|nr:intercompartmental signaling factor BofC [Salipaludibacillus agaradhaerens]MCR6106182.1 BofC C-terminal domain-containing protein [Salipaludibacillus agaradhaerens]MCR6118215.1 BofC C-terminal domain-containing protein [Salipaludibacillus agaradhaerens]UJW57331.1 BofC C-terminal domain-containing protein [Bacillus sp. A116_S68]